MRADLQRIYGICWDDVGDTVSVTHAAALVACLPLGSAVLEAINPKNRYTEGDWLLLGILNSLREKPIDPFAPKKARATKSMDADELMAVLSKPRRRVRDGN